MLFWEFLSDLWENQSENVERSQNRPRDGFGRFGICNFDSPKGSEVIPGNSWDSWELLHFPRILWENQR